MRTAGSQSPARPAGWGATWPSCSGRRATRWCRSRAPPTGPSPDQQQATAFFTTSARNILDAGERGGVSRLVLVSIIGIDRFQGGYMAAKLAQEQALLAGPIPTRILRAAQFHEFVGQFL